MPTFLFDTDHLTLFDHTDVAVWRHFAQHPIGDVALSPVSVEEYLRGRLAALARYQSGPKHIQAYGHLIDTLHMFQQFTIVPFDMACYSRYQQLRKHAHSHRHSGSADRGGSPGQQLDRRHAQPPRFRSCVRPPTC